MSEDSAEKAATYIRGTHPYSFRSGKWARVVARDTRLSDGRPTVLVEFPDGVTDTWVLDDAAAGYEIIGEPIEWDEDDPDDPPVTRDEDPMWGRGEKLLRSLFGDEPIDRASGVPHDHSEYVKGCFRCDLSRDETQPLPPEG